MNARSGSTLPRCLIALHRGPKGPGLSPSTLVIRPDHPVTKPPASSLTSTRVFSRALGNSRKGLRGSGAGCSDCPPRQGQTQPGQDEKRIQLESLRTAFHLLTASSRDSRSRPRHRAPLRRHAPW